MAGTLKLKMWLSEEIGKWKRGAVTLCINDIKTQEEMRQNCMDKMLSIGQDCFEGGVLLGPAV